MIVDLGLPASSRRLLLQNERLLISSLHEISLSVILHGSKNSNKAMVVAAVEEKKIESPPPYCSYVTFANFVKSLQATGIPDRIDKSVISTLSGSAQSALLSGLRWMGLTDDDGSPTAALAKLVASDETTHPDALREVLERSYAFMTDGSIQLSKATGSQVESKFREYGIHGSTVVKSIAFFIQAARAAKVPLGPHVKAPKQTGATNGSKRAARKQQAEQTSQVTDQPPLSSPPSTNSLPVAVPGFVRIAIPLHGMKDGAVFLPDNLSPTQWEHALKITKFLIDNYRLPEEAVESAPGGAQ